LRLSANREATENARDVAESGIKATASSAEQQQQQQQQEMEDEEEEEEDWVNKSTLTFVIGSAACERQK
jgi:predicted ATPase